MQSRNFIQYEGGRIRTGTAGDREATQKWRVVVNPRILEERRRKMVTRRARRLSRVLSVVTACILVGGLVMQISMMMALNAQSKRQSELYAEIQSLQNRKRTAQTSIENLSQLGRVEQGAQKLGLIYPQDSQLRAIGVRLSGSNTQFASAE